MAYSVDYRKRAVEYYQEGHTQKEVFTIFKVHPKTIRDWEARMMSGTLEPNYPKTRKPRKLPPDELTRYIDEHPDAFLKEIGDQFQCSTEGARKALLKLKITRKKRPLDTKNARKTPEMNMNGR